MEFVQAIDPMLVSIMNIGIIVFFTAVFAFIITSVFASPSEKRSNIIAMFMAVSFITMIILKFAGEAPNDSTKIELAKDLYGIELNKYHIESLDYPTEKPTEVEQKFGITTVDYINEDGIKEKRDLSLVWVNNELEIYENESELERIK